MGNKYCNSCKITLITLLQHLIAKTQGKYVYQAQINPDILLILSPNPIRKARPDLQLWDSM